MSTLPAVPAEQIRLFELGRDLSHLDAFIQELMHAHRAPKTIRAYGDCWNCFSRWCAQTGRSALPATPKTLEYYIAHCLEDRHLRLESVKLRLTAIIAYHRNAALPSPVTEKIRKMVANAALKLKERPGGKKALTIEQLVAISLELDDGTVLGTRDRAMIVLGYALGARRSELMALDRADVDIEPDGLMVRIWHSKTDQEGKGREMWIPRGNHAATCPVRLLQRWIELRGAKPGPLFQRITRTGRLLGSRLDGDALNQAVKRALRRIGEDPTPYGAHSLRAGLITSSLDRGASQLLIMQRTGHAKVSTLKRYVRPARALRCDPLAGAL